MGAMIVPTLLGSTWSLTHTWLLMIVSCRDDDDDDDDDVEWKRPLPSCIRPCEVLEENAHHALKATRE